MADNLKLAIAALILVAGMAGFYLLSEYSTLMRTLGLLAMVGLSAAVALARRVLEGGADELSDYLRFLSGGGSKDPLGLLRDAGVDMTKPEPVAVTLDRFRDLTRQLDELL